MITTKKKGNKTLVYRRSQRIGTVFGSENGTLTYCKLGRREGKEIPSIKVLVERLST